MRKRTWILLIILAGVLIIYPLFLKSSYYPRLSQLVADRVFDSHEHLLSCEQLPTLADARKIYADHREDTKKLEALDEQNHSVKVVLDLETCPGKADIVIYFGTHQQWLQIQQTIGANFFGIPYRAYNI